MNKRAAANTSHNLRREVANTRFLTIDGGTFRSEKLRRTRMMQDAAEAIDWLLREHTRLSLELEQAQGEK